MGWKVIVEELKRCVERPYGCIKRVIEMPFESAKCYIRKIDIFFKTVKEKFKRAWISFKKFVEKEINIRFLRKIAEKRMTPFVSFLISIVLVVILAIFLCIEQYSLAIAFIFGITTLLAWILSVFIYQEVRTHLGDLDDLLKRGSEYIEEATNKIVIVALAPNIGQGRRPSGFDEYKKSIEKQINKKQAKVEMLIPDKYVIQNFIEETLDNLPYIRDRKERRKAYRKEASRFFLNIMNKLDVVEGIVLSDRPPFTIIYIDDRITLIINNETFEGFLSVKPYEVKIVGQLIEFMKKTLKSTASFDLPKANRSGEWI